MSKPYFVVSDRIDDSLMSALPILPEQHFYCWVDAGQVDNIPEGADIFVSLPDELLAAFLVLANARSFTLTILAHKQAPHAYRGFCLANQKPTDLSPEQTKTLDMDVLFCNGEIVLNKVLLGRVLSFQPGGHSGGFKQRLAKMKARFEHFRDYQPQRFKIASTSNESVIETAAIGLSVMLHAFQSGLSKKVLPEPLLNDGMHHCLVIAPKSVLQMLFFMLTQPFISAVAQQRFLGVLRQKDVRVESPTPFDLTVDDRHSKSQIAELRVAPSYVRLNVTQDSPLLDGITRQKEIRRIQHVPKSKEAIHALVSKPLAWIAMAATDDFKELYQALRDNAKLSSTFVIFTILSTLLATLGLYANSAPVIIGAMILAPLMAPIISLAMAFARQDASLLQSSGKTLLTGLLVATGVAMCLSWLLPLSVQTPEIAARLRPTLLDLGIAFISGIAGAYSYARTEAAKSLAGVAIAVALVPPLAVTGIGLGWSSFSMAFDAFLLFVTNLAGIVLAASATFLMLGYAPFARARKGLLIALFAVTAVSVPLGLSFNQLLKEAAITAVINQVKEQNVEIRNVSVLQTRAPVVVAMDVVAKGVFDEPTIQTLKQRIELALDQPVTLEVTWVLLY